MHLATSTRFTARIYDARGNVIKWMSNSDMALLEKVVRRHCEWNADAHRFAIVNSDDEEVMYDMI
jgi:hypothetical protein